jgi:iron(III) transport system ATP-binding protein
VNHLRLTAVEKAFDGRAVLRGVDLEVPAGCLTAVLGPSGSGKTTLLRIVAGFELTDAGTVEIGGQVVDDGRRSVPPERRRIGYVPQDGALFPHLTVAANVGFGRSGLLRRRRDRETDALLDMVGLSDVAGRYPHELSGGQQQRVALARALAVRPTMVLLDEPFSSLDASMRASVRADVLQILRDRGVTTVLVTHDQDEALSVADEVAVIRHGVIGQRGAPHELYDHPVDPDMARFLGDANLVAGVVDGDAVTTPLGRLRLRPHPDRAQRDGEAVALLRPEQLAVSTALDHGGLPAVVVRREFHGHDTVITVAPSAHDFGDPLVVRADGDVAVTDGSAVTVTAQGSALAWPRDDR